MGKLLLNKARAYNDDETINVTSCEVSALIDSDLKIYKSAFNYDEAIDHPTETGKKVYVYANGEKIYYEILIVNYSTKNAKSVIITDELAKGLTYDNDLNLTIDGVKAAQPGIEITAETASEGEILEFTTVDIESGKSALLFFSVKQSAENGLVVDTIAENDGTISYKYENDEADRTTSTNEVYVKYIKNPPKLKIEKSGPSSTQCNKEFEYTLTVTNEGGEDTDKEIIITDEWQDETFMIKTPEKEQVSITINTGASGTEKIVNPDDYTVVSDSINKKLIITIADTVVLPAGKIMTINILGSVPCS